jgi:hypothetical protein
MDERLASDVNGMAVWHLLGVDVRTHEKEGKMTREEAAKKWEWVVENFNDPAIYLWPDEGQKLIESISLLRNPIPDPITGLVPCGCGGKATRSYSSIGCVVFCASCGLSTKNTFFASEAVNAWNVAMGYKGGAE